MRSDGEVPCDTGPMEPGDAPAAKTQGIGDLWPRWLIAAAGLAPISVLCGSLIGLIPLRISAPIVVLPVALAAVFAGIRAPGWGRLAAIGLGSGAAATAAYDVLRLTLVQVGVFVDFIPEIGVLLGATDAAAPLGYFWRFVGNGGGLGVAFLMLPWRGVLPGMLYGTAVCFCLFATVGLFPGAAEVLFELSPATVAGALAGHWIYGAVLGALTARHPVPHAACGR